MTQKVRKKRTSRHSERCHACKVRVAQLLERIYGHCELDHSFGWRTGLADYEQTSIDGTLREVARALERHRGFAIGEFVRSRLLARCDYWVPDPGCIVEFDESQHFTASRRLALSVFADMPQLGFSAKRWMGLCDHHNARDNDPPFRDEQRAWYDTLRDLVPLINGMEPTARLYARDEVWCALDPDSPKDQEHFLGLLHRERTPSRLLEGVPCFQPPKSTLRVAMVFPQIKQGSSHGIPPACAGAQEPDVPTADSFTNENADLVLFPEAYIEASDEHRSAALQRLSSDLGATLMVGAIERNLDSSGRAWQVLLRFDPDGSRSRVYTKHSTACAVAFELPDWEVRSMLPTFELNGVTGGATICHDHYLGLFARSIAERGARLWVNPSFDNVTDAKWSSVLRLRAVENRFFALCTLHCDVNKRRTHPFGFAPDGHELTARQAGTETARPLSQCFETGTIYMIYVVDLDLAAAGRPLDWLKLPPAEKLKRPRNGTPIRPIRVALSGGQPTVSGLTGREDFDSGFRADTKNGPVFVGLVPGEQILDASACFRVLDLAKERNCAPLIWNQWKKLPAESGRLANLMMGRSIECCAPIVISDQHQIHELVELTNKSKLPARRQIEPSGEAIVDLGRAWGLDNAFKIVSKHLRAEMRETALDRYRSLG